MRLSKRMGQHFLMNKEILEFEVEQGELSEKDKVLEIGSGYGNLTELIAEKAGTVYAVEPDKRFVGILREKFEGNERVKVIGKRFEEVKDEIEFDKCISNIPFYLSSPVVEYICKRRKMSVILFQKEFAERLIAEPGDKNYSRISIISQFYTIPVMLLEVGREEFYPEPEVDSAIVKFYPRKKIFDVNEEKFFEFVGQIFSHSKNTVRKALMSEKKRIGLNKEKLNGIPYLERRVRSLNINELINLFEEVQNALQDLQEK